MQAASSKPRTLITSYSNKKVPIEVAKEQDLTVNAIIHSDPSLAWMPVRADSRAMHYQFIDAVTKEAFAYYSNVMFLDVDCVPLSKNAIYKLIENAESGRLAGVEQVASHINSGRHPYVSPVAACISKSVFEKLGRPSAIQDENGDVMESFTTKAEALGMGIAMIPILKCLGERLWSTPDGRAYGLGTIYGYNSEVLFFHNFCSGSRLPATDHLRHFYSICKKTRFEIEAGKQDACQTVFD